MPAQGAKASVEIGGHPARGEGRTRRAYLSTDKLIERPAPGINTMADVLQFALKKFGSKPILGWRDVVRMHEEEKEVVKKVDGREVKELKKWSYYELSDYKFLTYTQFNEKVEDASSGLVYLGLNNKTRFNIYASTALNWQLMAHSCFRQNISFCTAYDTLGEEGLEHSLNEPEVVGIFTNADLLGTLGNVIGKTPTVKYVIYDGEPEKKTLEKLNKALEGREGAKVITLQQLLRVGRNNPADPHPPKASDVACIMYTSGSTGAPKGVILQHSNLVSAVGAVVALLGVYLKPDDTFLAYLPLAHILEFIVECSLLYVGVPMGYGKVKTLTQASVRHCDGDIKAFRPSVMVGVPAVWELIRKGILAKVNSAGGVKKSMFNGALTVKKNKIPVLSGIVDAVVFKAVKDQTGGRLRLALSGGAPISRETQQFLDLALVQLLQGYGMTESCGMCAILTPDFMQYGSVGVVVPAIEVKFVDVPDAGYYSTNDPPQGEVLIRGPAVTKGYFKREDVNKETFTEDGWLMTGDVGQWNKDGTLSIIDRKKNLVKLQGGEYIAIERLESMYKSCDLVANICVHASSEARQPMGLIFPREDNFRAALQRAGISGAADDEMEDLCKNSQARDILLKETNAVGKKAGLKSLEILQTCILVPQELPMTAAQKLQRKDLLKEYDARIKKIYP